MKFEVGDRVTTKLGETGTVIDVERLSGNVAVEMDDPNSGVFVQTFPGKHVLWLSEEAWKKIEQKSKILITSDGHTTTARLYDCKKVIRSAEAKCNPDDKFDFATGAKLAFDRLMGTDKPKGWNGKVVCVDDDGSQFVTAGKIYSFVDGWSKDNTGNKLFSAPMKSLDEINHRVRAKFIEFKGESDAK